MTAASAAVRLTNAVEGTPAAATPTAQAAAAPNMIAKERPPPRVCTQFVTLREAPYR